MFYFLSIISNHSSFPFPGKENQRWKGTQWKKQQLNLGHPNPSCTTLDCLQSHGILNVKMHYHFVNISSLFSLAVSRIKSLHLKKGDTSFWILWKFRFICTPDSFFLFFSSSSSSISKIFFLLNRFQLFIFSPSSSFLLASLPTPTTEPTFVCFTLNQNSFIKNLLISFLVVKSTDYCDNCKTFRAFPHTLC